MSATNIGKSTGPFMGLRVIDLTQGIAGAIATMLLSDSGAEVLRIDQPNDPFATLSGYRVWQRGKTRVQLDPVTESEKVAELIAHADVVVTSWEQAPEGLDVTSLMNANPRLVHCAITAYGDVSTHRGRPAIDSLVAARTGLAWELRGIPGTTIGYLSKAEDILGHIESDPTMAVGPNRPGPMFPGIPWAQNATAYLATIGISAALLNRTKTGKGQSIATSILQGALCAASIPWLRVENVYADGFLGWTTDPRAPKGYYKSADGKWIQQWVQLPSFMLGVGGGDEMVIPESGASPRDADLRIETDYADMVMLHHFHPLMKEAAAKHTAADWEKAATQLGVPFEIIRSPEDALLDPSFLADGCVTEIHDPELGPIRAVGSVLRYEKWEPTVPTRVAEPGGDTDSLDEIITSWKSEKTARNGETQLSGSSSAPLAGVRVLDLGLAIAGPFGAQLLADLGADVIRVHAPRDEAWMNTQYSHMSNRGKRSIGIDLKQPGALELFYELVKSADVVHHNMRPDAAKKLKIDPESLSKVNPNLIYCHTRGYEEGARADRAANDQTAAAIAGTGWVDGGTDNGGTPIWPSISLGDTGNGLLSAIAVLQALYHRELAGEAQKVGTSIVYAHLLNASMAWSTPDGSVTGNRPRVGEQAWGTDATHRYYPTSEGYLALAAIGQTHWEALTGVIAELADERFSTIEKRREHNADLNKLLEQVFAAESARTWCDRLDAAGVPAEVVASGPGTVFFDDPEFKERELITSYTHPVTGRMEMIGRLIDIAGAKPSGAPPLLGEHTREILLEMGRSDSEIDQLVNDGVVAVAKAAEMSKS